MKEVKVDAFYLHIAHQKKVPEQKTVLTRYVHHENKWLWQMMFVDGITG